jgi:hypothetical protein
LQRGIGLLQVAPDYMKPVNYDTRKLLRLLGPQLMTSYDAGIGQRWGCGCVPLSLSKRAENCKSAILCF